MTSAVCLFSCLLLCSTYLYNDDGRSCDVVVDHMMSVCDHFDNSDGVNSQVALKFQSLGK